MLPVLTVNHSFMHKFMDAETPCGALGLVEENGRQSGFMALHLDVDVPFDMTARGFRLGHSLLGNATFDSDPPCLRVLWISDLEPPDQSEQPAGAGRLDAHA